MAEEEHNPSIAQSVAVIAEQAKVQTRILDRMENRQFEASKIISTHSVVSSKEHLGIRGTLKNYFKLIIILITIVGGLVGAKIVFAG